MGELREIALYVTELQKNVAKLVYLLNIINFLVALKLIG